MPRVEALTGLRFFAAAAIVLWHSQLPHFFPWGAFTPFALVGAVGLFFVLSGYVLATNAPKYRSWTDFFVARVARIWPVHIVSLIFCVVVFYPGSLAWVDEAKEIPVLALNILLLQSWFPDRAIYWSFNLVAWSISCEMFFYAMFPICLWAMRRSILKGVAAILFLGAAFLLILEYLLPNDGKYLNIWIGYINPITTLPLFALGIALGLTQHHLPPAKLSFWSGTLLQIAALALVMWTNAYFASIVLPEAPGLMVFLNWHGAFWAYAILIFVLARYKGALARFLSFRPLIYLGEISFAMYLFHQPILNWHSKNYKLIDLNIWVQYALLWAAIIATSAAAHHIIERPAQRLIKNGWSRRRLVNQGKTIVSPAQ